MDRREKIAEVLKRTRTDAGVSMEEMARRMKVSKKTIQNWESCVGCPPLDLSLEWFSVLKVQPIPYYLQLIYDVNLDAETKDKDVENALISIIKELTPAHKRQLLYCLFAHHGSSPSSILEMVTAHLHTPLRDRINIALAIVNNYKLARAKGEIIVPGVALPDMDNLETALHHATEAAIMGDNEYITTEGDYHEIKAWNAIKRQWVDRI